MIKGFQTQSVLHRLGELLGARTGRSAVDVTVGELNADADRPLGIEPLEECIAPGVLIVNPPGHGHGTEVELPDAADHGRARGVDRSPALEDPPPTEPPIGGF